MFRDINKSPSFQEMEKQILSLWDKDRSFQKSVENRENAPDFIFYDGPPFATGLPHYGHLLAGTIKDIIPRYWTMRGYRVKRRFGWDCHGLPIESLIQNELDLASTRDIRYYGVDRFNENCRSSVFKYTREWRETVRKMGRWVDFEDEYRTMDRNFMESVWWVFQQCYNRGLIYQDYRIQPYSPALATPLSNFEVNQGYQDRQDPSITLTFPLKGVEGELLVWTTTPWTLPSNLAIAVKPDLQYAQVNVEGKKYWLAEARVSSYFGDEVKIEQVLTGDKLVGVKYQPLFQYAPQMSDKQYSLMAADFVSDADGTGAVHIAPSFGEDDFVLGKQEGLGLFDPLDAEGKFTSEVPDWQGKGAKDADKEIIQKLKVNGRVYKHETLVHSYPHCWRTGVPLLYRALKTWFLSLEKTVTSQSGETKTLKQWMIDCNNQINWVPGHIREGRFGKWLEGVRDWNLGRNRFWGTPIPVWQSEDGDEICIGSVAELENLTGQQCNDLHMHIVDTLEIKTKDKKNYDSQGKSYFRTSEVLDCWFESGSMPYAQSHFPFEGQESFKEVFPADFIAEGLDQTRGWFYTLTVLGAALFQKPAFKNVVVNGIILAEDGQKMSKRLRNYPDPNELISRTSADAIRLFMINSAAVKAEELKFSEKGVREIIRSVVLPLHNALYFMVSNAEADHRKGQLEWKPGDAVASPTELDRWILADLQELLKVIHTEMEAFRLYNVVPSLVQFIDDLTNWYVRRSRRRFWKSENDTDKNAAYGTLYTVLVEFSKALAPFLPFLAEEIYQVLVREKDSGAKESVHLCDLPQPDSELTDHSLLEKMAVVREAVNLGRSLRASHNLKNRQPLRSMKIAVRSEQDKVWILSLTDLIREELNVKSLEVSLKESDLVIYKAKANFKSLGPKLGKKVKEVASEVAKLDHEQIREILSGKSVQISGIEIGTGDLQIQREVREHLVVDTGSRTTIALDTQIDEELIEEMLARECVSKIQNLRKQADFAITDKIDLVAFTQSSRFQTVFSRHNSYITSEVLAETFDVENKDVESSEDFVEYKDEKVAFQLKKAKD